MYLLLGWKWCQLIYSKQDRIFITKRHPSLGHVTLVAIYGTTILLPNLYAKLLQHIWRSGSGRFHLPEPDLQMCCSDLRRMKGYQDSNPGNGHQVTCHSVRQNMYKACLFLLIHFGEIMLNLFRFTGTVLFSDLWKIFYLSMVKRHWR